MFCQNKIQGKNGTLLLFVYFPVLVMNLFYQIDKYQVDSWLVTWEYAMAFANTGMILQCIIDESLIKFLLPKMVISKLKAPSTSMLAKSVLIKTLED